MWAHIIVLRLSFKLEVENWRLTHRALLHQYFPTLAARSLKLKTFSTTKHLSVFCLMCSCFLDAARTFLRSNHPTQTCYSFLSSPPFSEEKSVWGAAKKPPNLESHLNANDERLWLARRHLRCRWLVILPQLWLARRHLRCRWLVILPHVETTVRHSDWLYKRFSHVKIKRIDFYK